MKNLLPMVVFGFLAAAALAVASCGEDETEPKPSPEDERALTEVDDKEKQESFDNPYDNGAADSTGLSELEPTTNEECCTCLDANACLRGSNRSRCIRDADNRLVVSVSATCTYANCKDTCRSQINPTGSDRVLEGPCDIQQRLQCQDCESGENCGYIVDLASTSDEETCQKVVDNWATTPRTERCARK